MWDIYRERAYVVIIVFRSKKNSVYTHVGIGVTCT